MSGYFCVLTVAAGLYHLMTMYRTIKYIECDACSLRVEEDLNDPDVWIEVHYKGEQVKHYCNTLCMLGNFGLPHEVIAKARSKTLGLTQVEMTVIRQLAMGKSNSEIAVGLKLQESTIKNRMSELFRKMHVDDRFQLVLVASFVYGLVDIRVEVDQLRQKLGLRSNDGWNDYRG